MSTPRRPHFFRCTDCRTRSWHRRSFTKATDRTPAGFVPTTGPLYDQAFASDFSRKGDAYASPTMLIACVDIQLRTVAFGDLTHDRKAQAGAFTRRAGDAVKALEDLAPLGGRGSPACVHHAQIGKVPVATRCNRYPSACGRIAQCVVDEVVDQFR